MQSSTEPQRENLTFPERPMLLFFDGQCVFCNRWVNRLKDADHAQRIRFGTKQGKTFQRLAQIHPEIAKVESVVLVYREADDREAILVRSSAIRVVLKDLSGFHFFALILRIFPTALSDVGYRIFSKLRLPLFGRLSQCRVPTEQERELFVE